MRSKHGAAAAVILWLNLFSTIGVEPALGHGDHGDASPSEGSANLVALDGLQVELLTAPNPVRVGEESKIVAKILRAGSLEPVRGAKVAIGVAPARHHSSHSNRNFASQQDPRQGWNLLPAPELVWAGSYTLVRRLEERGPHLVQVALLEIDGRRLDPPTMIEFRLNVAPSSGLTPGLTLLFLTAAGIALVGSGWVIVRLRPQANLREPFNLLEIGWLNRLVRWRGFQPALQWPVLALTLLIVLLGFFDINDGATNVATKLTWIIWWPGIVFTFVLVGRLWCVLCPFGALNEAAAKAARSERLFPKALRNLWPSTLLFVLLTWADEQLGIVRSPQATAWLIIFFTLVSVATGLFFQRRTFCRYLCPITGLQGLYSMISPVELRAADVKRCQKECHQDCYRGNDRGAGCPMFEFPMTVDRNTYCNFCFECVKSCPPGNLALRLRPFGKDLWASRRRSLDESYLALALVGITSVVSAQMLTDWSGWISRLSRLIPDAVRVLMKPVTYLAVTESALYFVASLALFPLALLAAAWASTRMSGNKGSGVKKAFIHLGYMFVPVGLAMHLAHNTQHLLLEGPGLLPALQRVVNKYTPFYAGAVDWNVGPLVSPEVIYWLQMTLLLAGFAFSIGLGYRLAGAAFAERETAGKRLIPFIVLSLLFTLLNLYLLNQPMGMRHT